MSKPTIEEWKPNMEITCVSDAVWDILSNVLVVKFPHVWFNTGAHHQPGNDMENPYRYFYSKLACTFIHLDMDGTLYAVPKNYVKKRIFNKWCAYDHVNCVARLEYDILAAEDWKNHDRVVKGIHDIPKTPLKWGALVKDVCRMCDDKTISLICDAIADKVKSKYGNDFAVQVSDKPSTVYTATQDFKSCMIGFTEEKFLIYDDIPTTSIAYITDDKGIVKARALLHQTTYYKKPLKIMDRIYYSDSMYLGAMVKWANENGYWHKTKQALDWNVYTNGEGHIKKFQSMRMPLPDFVKGRYIDTPYIDTFCKLCENSDKSLYLAQKTVRGVRVLSTMQQYNRNHVPIVLRDTDARECNNCHRLNRAHNLVKLLGYHKYRNETHEVVVCKDCARKLMPCPVCGAYYIWKEGFAPDYSDSFNRVVIGGEPQCQKCWLDRRRVDVELRNLKYA